MPDGPYERDAFAWAEQQAELLRRLAAGERLNAQVDWPHVIEEVRDVGLSELRACQSLLQQAMAHLVKLQARPDGPSAVHWRDEAGTFLDDAARRFTSSMRQRMDFGELYARALRRAGTALSDLDAAYELSETCPFTLDALLAGDVATLELLANGQPEAPRDGSPD